MGLFCSFCSNRVKPILWLSASLLHKYIIFPPMDFFLEYLCDRLKTNEGVFMVLCLSFFSKCQISPFMNFFSVCRNSPDLPFMLCGLCWIYKHSIWHTMSVCLYPVVFKNVAVDCVCRIWPVFIKTLWGSFHGCCLLSKHTLCQFRSTSIEMAEGRPMVVLSSLQNTCPSWTLCVLPSLVFVQPFSFCKYLCCDLEKPKDKAHVCVVWSLQKPTRSDLIGSLSSAQI